MQTVLVTGANRGLGLEFCRQYAKEGWRVLATCRNPDTAEALIQLARQYASIQIEALDVADFTNIDGLAKRLATDAIDVLINNAGVYGDEQSRGFGSLDYVQWQTTLTINTVAPVKMAEAFLSQLQQGKRRLIVNVSSLMGSISDNGSGGSLLYRSSKAGLNAVMHSLAIDLSAKSIGVLILHPGWVKTDMGGPNALITVEESVTGMKDCIDRFTLSHSGDFLKYDGSPMPW